MSSLHVCVLLCQMSAAAFGVFSSMFKFSIGIRARVVWGLGCHKLKTPRARVLAPAVERMISATINKVIGQDHLVTPRQMLLDAAVLGQGYICIPLQLR